MKYQFKTINYQPTNNANNSFNYSSRNQFGQATSYTQSFSANQPFSSLESGRPTNFSQAGGSNSQNQVNISQMKKKLDLLLQQTDSFQSRKSYPSRNQSLQNNLPRLTSPERGGKPDTNQFQSKTDRLKNLQKYQKIIEESKSTRERFSLNQPSSSYNGWQANNYRASDGKQSSLGKYQPSYGTSKMNDTSIDSKVQTNYKPAPTRDYISSRVSTQRAEADPSYRSYNDISRFPLIINKSQNPERQISSTSYDKNLTSNNYSSSPKKDVNYVAQNNERKNSNFQSTYAPKYDTNSYGSYGGNPVQIGSRSQRVMTQQAKSSSIRVNPVFNEQENTIPVKTTKPQSVSQNSEMKVYQLQSKITALQTENDSLKQSIKDLRESKQYYRNELSNERSNTKKVSEEYENKISLLSADYLKRIQSLQDKIAGMDRQNYQKIKKVEQSYDQKMFKLSEQSESKLEAATTNLQTKIAELTKQLQKKQQKIISLVKQIGSKQATVQLREQMQQHQTSQTKSLQNDLDNKNVVILQLKNQINARQKRIQMLNSSIEQLKSEISSLKAFKAESQTEKYSDFDSILLTQMQTINQLKDKIEQLNQKSNELRTDLIESNRKNDSMLNEIKIMELKHRSELNAVKMQADINLNNKDNMIGTLNKRMTTLQQKIKLAASEIKSKDEFMKQHLVGRTQSGDMKQYIESVLGKYQQAFSNSKEDKLTAEVEKLQKQLELYEKYA